jgi:nicotinate-nucleotide pyrophosphorylase (carboxylating)
MGLFDAVLIKDNHIQAAGGIRPAIDLARKSIPHTMKIEVEVENLEGVKEALDAGADIIMLDNMAPELMRQAVQMIGGRAITEASGNITHENIQAAAASGIDVISMGTLTHTVRSLDISLNINPKKVEELESRH